MTNTWVLNKTTGKWEAKSANYQHPKPKEMKMYLPSKKKKKKRKKVDKKTAAAYYGQKQLDLAALKKSRL
jgi:hypothetical protein